MVGTLNTDGSSNSRTALRNPLLARRKALSVQEGQIAANNILLHIQSWYAELPQSHKTRSVAGYLATGGEVDLAATLQWFRSKGVLTYVPIIRPEFNGVLKFAPLSESTHLVTGQHFNICEPVFETGDLIQAQAIDIVLMPLVGFDLKGNRIGMGGGYYDRSFNYRLQDENKIVETAEQISEQKLIGVAHDFQQLDDAPSDWWDVPLDAAITDQAIYNFN